MSYVPILDMTRFIPLTCERTYKKNTDSYFNLYYNISKVHQNWKGTFARISLFMNKNFSFVHVCTHVNALYVYKRFLFVDNNCRYRSECVSLCIYRNDKI